MAHFCPDCRITFENRVPNCPRCGYGIANDSQPESYYLDQGYVRFDPANRAATSVHIQDDDILNELRNRYRRYVNNPEPPADPARPQPSFDEHHQETPPSNDFFASFSNDEIHPPQNTPEPEPEPDPAPAPEPTPRRRNNNYRAPGRRWGGGGSRIHLSQIPWRAIICFVLFIAVIAIIVNIWNMRFAILNSVVDFVSSIMPLVIIVIAIIYLIRSIFRP